MIVLFKDVYAEALLKTDFAASRRIVLRGRTSAVIDQIPDQSLDFAYIDGDHTLRGITVDLIQVLPKIKDGGLIGGDDFVNKPWQDDAAYEPTLVCPFAVYFAEAMGFPFVALPHKQFLIQKSCRRRVLIRRSSGNVFRLVFEETLSGLSGQDCMNPALACASARIKSQRVSSGEHNSTRFRDSEADHDSRKLYGDH